MKLFFENTLKHIEMIVDIKILWEEHAKEQLNN